MHQTGHKAPTDHAVQSNSRAQFSVCITKQGRLVKFEKNAIDYSAVECNILNCKAVGDASGTVQQNGRMGLFSGYTGEN